ncbi:MAG: DNA polymerase III subunit gamma/tau [Candidatus Taylorbacteria bacterium]|nr:DNA polymerase III subunit gamma/tau [Candidatus Taylorbacteria bacterium]
MSHEVLYRKYRPQNFKEVIGQDSVVKALKGAIESGAVAHAYLFAGSRGIGKTSIARIFANEIGTSPNDVYEIDAASNRGIDDIRALRDAVATLPFESKFKVYIIDEVHMLTKEAFNALLKTLEEPPKHVVFILATTEVHKLPETIVSRCQVFEFKRPTLEILKDVVTTIAKKEGFSIEPSAAELVALVGDGSFRDTHGTLERVIAGISGKKISKEDVEEATGAPKSELVRGFVLALANKDSKAAFDSLAKLRAKSFDPKLFLELSVSLVRLALFVKMGVSSDLVDQASDEDKAFFKDVSAKVDSKLLRSLLGAFDYIGVSPIRELPLELAVLDIAGEKEQRLFA